MEPNNLQSGIVWGVHGVDRDLAALPAVQAVQLKLIMIMIMMILLKYVSQAVII